MNSDKRPGTGVVGPSPAGWRKSSHSGSNGGTCVEVGTLGPAIAVRDSNHPNNPQLAFASATWQAFTNQLKATAEPRRAAG